MTMLQVARRRRDAGGASVGGRQLVFEDRFDRGLDPRNWFAEVRHDTGSRLQAFTARPENVRVENERLHIEAHRETYGGKTWTSGLVTTRGQHEFLYGRIEVRAKTPVVNRMWPAIWTLGQTYWVFYDWLGGATSKGYSPGALCGEIDIMEAWGDQPGSSAIAHYAPYLQTAKTSFTHDRHEWVTYALEWTPDALGFSVDGSQPQMFPTAGIPQFHIPHHLILNLAVDPSETRSGVDNPAVMSALMEVDWVRVWTMEGDVVRVPLGITLDQSSVTVATGAYVHVGQRITPHNAQDQGTSWTSDNPAVARAGNGWISGVAPGSCTVTARTWNGVQSTLAVTVT